MDLKSLKNNVNILKEEFVESSSEKDSMSSVISIEQNKIVKLKEKLKSAKTENEKNEIMEEIDNCKSCIREMESLLDEATMEKYTKEVLLTTEKEKLYGKEEKKTGKIERIKSEFNEAKTERETMNAVIKAEKNRINELEDKLEMESSDEEKSKINEDIKNCKENLKELNKFFKEPETKEEYEIDDNER